ncbi:MAG: HNH endonuclease [Parasphingorhabdus sp.]|uniref:HNH endonuclease n=1 Tax=Parasphingorhabdus sp. TaxID=2709688 RepID=UPI00329A2159
MAKRPPSFTNPKGKKRSGWSKKGRKSAHERGYGWAWRKLRAFILRRDKGLCQPCLRNGVTTLAREVDHIIPKEWGGSDDEGNLQSICIDCHKAKTAEEGNTGKAMDHRLASNPMAHPPWLCRSVIPVTIVTGPPGSGKSSYVNDHAGDSDCVICFDQIAANLFKSDGQRVHQMLSGPQVKAVLQERNKAIGRLMTSATNYSKAWIIVSDAQSERRRWWSETLGADVVVMLTPASVCKARITKDEANGERRPGNSEAIVDQWWWNYTPWSGDQVVKPQRKHTRRARTHR